ncbi:MAG: group II truncated hemoglobin [Candidatus Competibacteraceae bacterium]
MPPTPYERLGGAEKVRELVDHFYTLMDTLPEAWEVRRLHPENLDHAREKLFLFLSGWLGGPALYVERYGHPRLRARHLPFAIGIRERDQWLLCMFQAMEDLGVEKLLALQLQRSFFMTADHMRNQPEPDIPSRLEQ